MKYIFFIILIIIAIFISYKIITPFSFPSKYYEGDGVNWHFFTKDKNIIREFTKYHFFIKSVHLAGDFEKLKLIEIQTFLPFFIFKFYEIKGFLPQKSPYGISYIAYSVQKGDLNQTLFKFGKVEIGGFGWIKTEPEIKFKIKKNKYFEFESIVKTGNLPAENGVFKIKNYDLEIYKASSPHFSLLFPKIEEIEVYFKEDKGFFKIKEKGKERTLKFGNLGGIQEKSYNGNEFSTAHNYKEELSFYLKATKIGSLKKFIKIPFFDNLEQVQIKCGAKKNSERCSGYFEIKKNQIHREYESFKK